MAGLTEGQSIYVGFAGIFMFMSVFTNFCIIYIVLTKKHMQTVTNIFISNLSASDAFMGGIIVPQMIHDISHTDEYDEGDFACRFVTALPIICICSSIYSLVMMAVERYRAICTTSGSMSKPLAKKLCCLAWLLAGIVSLPTMFEYQVLHTPINHTALALAQTTASPVSEDPLLVPYKPAEPVANFSRSCSSTQGQTYGLMNGFFLLLVAYLIPLIIISISYSKVALFIINQSKQQEQQAGGQGKSNFAVAKNSVRIVKMLVVVAVLFAISWAPYFILLITAKITGADDSGEAGSVVNLLKIALTIFSVNYNVFLYINYTASFRTAFRALLCPCLKTVKVAADGATQMDQSVVQEE